jgi:hypothetical protein
VVARRELAYAAAALVGVGLLVFAPYVPNGGFYEDDWGNASLYRERGYWDMAFDFWLHSKPWRPVLALLLPLPHALFGLTPSFHLATGLVLAILASLAFFVFMRAVGIEPRHAIAVSLLALVFPWSDALRLWATGSLNNIAPMTYFLGAAVAIQALRLEPAQQPRRRVLHALSVVLYLVSLFTYEIAAPAIALSGLVYRRRVSWAALRARWLLDAVIVLVWLVAVVYPSSRLHDVRSLSDRVAALPETVVQASSLFASMFLPRDISSPVAKLLVLVGVGVVLGTALRRIRDGDAGELRTWLLRAGAGVCAVGVGYVMFLGYGYPLAEGPENRVNALSSYGFVVAAYSVVALLCLLVARSRVAPSFPILLVGGTLLLGLGFVDRVRADAGRYEASAAEQTRQLATLRRMLPRMLPHTTVFTFGHSLTSGHGVPILDAPWVLTAAVQLRWKDPSLRAASAVGRDVSCARDVARVAFHIAGSDVIYAARYGRAEFVDLSLPSVRHVDSRHDCREALAAFGSRAG